MISHETHRGSRIYSKAILGFYDLLVVKFSNTYAWRCPRRLMLDQYNRLTSSNHLDVGPGTGWYLAHTDIPPRALITLMDLNSNSLASAAKRLGTTKHRAIVGNVLDPLPADVNGMDSIALNFLMHCVPGSWASKGVAFQNLAAGLSDKGTLFGSTILGAGIRHNFVARRFMRFYNRLGIFHNTADDSQGLQHALDAAFADVTVSVVGNVALFTARAPRRP